MNWTNTLKRNGLYDWKFDRGIDKKKKKKKLRSYHKKKKKNKERYNRIDIVSEIFDLGLYIVALHREYRKFAT